MKPIPTNDHPAAATGEAMNGVRVVTNHAYLGPALQEFVPNATTEHGEVAMSQTEQANRAFLGSIQSIPGVIAAKPYGGKTLAEQSVAVVVPEMGSPTSAQVFELEGEIFRKYPGARLDVRVIGLRERGLDPSQFASVLPE